MKRIAALIALLACASSAGAIRAQAASGACGGGSNYTVPLSAAPFAVMTEPDGQHAFVSLNSTRPDQLNGLAILACTDGRYAVQRVIPLEDQPTGMALTHSGDLLVLADDVYVAFVDMKKVLAGDPDVLAGYFEDIPDDDGGAVYANVSADDHLAFISEEQSGTITVIDLRKGRQNHFDRSSIIGEIQLGRAPVALVLSKDGRYLFTTIQGTPADFGFAKTCKTEGVQGPQAKDEAPGAVIVIDVAKAATDPANSIVSKTPADCHPVRASLSPDGESLWVTARASNTVLQFSTAKLIAGDAKALMARVAVGKSPVPVIATADGRFVLSANTDRFAPGPPQDQQIDVIDARSAKVVGHIPAGKFPREFSGTRSGATIFLANFSSDSLTVIDANSIESTMIKE